MNWREEGQRNKEGRGQYGVSARKGREGASREREDERMRGIGTLLPGGWGTAISWILHPILSCKMETM